MNIIIGRTEDEIEKLGTKGTIFIGKEYIKMEQVMSLANRVFLDVNKPHLILICGKRGSGKSYTLAVIAEEIASLDPKLRKEISIIIFDTMGIFWTMKFPNYKEAELLEEWGLKPKELKNVRVLVPFRLKDKYEFFGVPVDGCFALNPSDLSPFEWTLTFNLKPTSPVAAFISKIIRDLKENSSNYSLQDIISKIEKSSTDPKIKELALNYFYAAEDWGLFSEKAHRIEDLAQPGYVNILDISMYTALTGGWSVKNLVIGLVSKRLFYNRLLYRKKEEVEQAIGIEKTRDFPLIWIMIDEAHEALPKDSVTPATEPLIQIIREGRQPGITLVLATQQPGKMHTDVWTQTDIVISHRLTSKVDLQALNIIMQNFVSRDIYVYMNENLPKRKGAALILDDKSERIIPVQIRPRYTWHGGADPELIRR